MVDIWTEVRLAGCDFTISFVVSAQGVEFGHGVMVSVDIGYRLTLGRVDRTSVVIGGDRGVDLMSALRSDKRLDLGGCVVQAFTTFDTYTFVSFY